MLIVSSQFKVLVGDKKTENPSKIWGGGWAATNLGPAPWSQRTTVPERGYSTYGPVLGCPSRNVAFALYSLTLHRLEYQSITLISFDVLAGYGYPSTTDLAGLLQCLKFYIKPQLTSLQVTPTHATCYDNEKAHSIDKISTNEMPIDH